MFTRLSLNCPVCKSEYDWHRGYGREIRCCCKECHDEAEWRRTLSIMGKQYEPQPMRDETPQRARPASVAQIEAQTKQVRKQLKDHQYEWMDKGDQLKAHREAMDFSLKDAAQILGMDKEVIDKMERGSIEPDMTILERLL